MPETRAINLHGLLEVLEDTSANLRNTSAVFDALECRSDAFSAQITYKNLARVIADIRAGLVDLRGYKFDQKMHGIIFESQSQAIEAIESDEEPETEIILDDVVMDESRAHLFDYGVVPGFFNNPLEDQP